jgi:hypothetical protein
MLIFKGGSVVEVVGSPRKRAYVLVFEGDRGGGVGVVVVAYDVVVVAYVVVVVAYVVVVVAYVVVVVANVMW